MLLFLDYRPNIRFIGLFFYTIFSNKKVHLNRPPLDVYNLKKNE